MTVKEALDVLICYGWVSIERLNSDGVTTEPLYYGEDEKVPEFLLSRTVHYIDPADCVHIEIIIK